MTILSDIIKAGSLELTMNTAINQIPILMKSLRSLAGQKYFMYKSEEDFVLGWILGRIVAPCEVILSGFGGWRNLEPGDYQELGNLLNNRMAQIRSKIYETG